MNITLVMPVAIAALPLRPLQTLSLGLAMWATYVEAVVIFPEQALVADETPLFLAALVVVILICTVLAQWELNRIFSAVKIPVSRVERHRARSYSRP